MADSVQTTPTTTNDFTPPQTRAECVKWLRARAERYSEMAAGFGKDSPQHRQERALWDMAAGDLAAAADDLEAGERP